jgi:hypothetical protein
LGVALLVFAGGFASRAAALFALIPIGGVGALLIFAGSDLALSPRLFAGRPSCLWVIGLTAVVTLTVNSALALMLGWIAEFVRVAIVGRLVSAESVRHRVAIRQISHMGLRPDDRYIRALISHGQSGKLVQQLGITLGRLMAEKATSFGLRFLLAGRERGRLSLPSPEEGRRLVVAFMGIKDAAAREKIISLVERKSQIDQYSGSQRRTITSSVRMRFWVEAGLAALCGFLALLTLFTRGWIEAFTGFNPDNHNGSFEWTIVAALCLVSILLSIAAHADWHRLSSAAHAGI